VRPKSKQSGTVQPDSGELPPSRPCHRAWLATQPAAESASRTKQRFVALGRRRASRSVATAGRPIGRTIHGKCYGVGGDQVPTGWSSRFRTRPPQPGFGEPGPPSLRSGWPQRPGPCVRVPSARCRRRPLRGRPPGLPIDR